MILLDSDSHSGLIQNILRADHWLFNKVNQDWTGPFGDLIFPFLREAEFWVPFYLFLLVFITLNFGKKGWRWALFLVTTAAISDQVSSDVIKRLVFRLRPCHNPELADNIHILVGYCPVSSSFTSSHACNHFAAAWFIFLTLRHTSRWWGWVFAWAFLISYAQVYVGVHYPVDIACGALVGSMIGWLLARVFKWLSGTLTPHISQPYNHQHV
ncbi:MAG TPA: phosphatase PAP2 family protein [Puia sp.]|uniref:phosphatase PAP2 family protein n=1 Tax=Puia sp. TaxID=2045100 RepID=UPI002C91A221|nr:phosphatase PAP2 family protein [Puia sp.]HVU95916.1 phosphatase PAP2 family protein [Puia sp.]